ncbi:MAG: ribulose-phosphate 3-epimerase [Candidatus Tectomicrobia bacterium]|uniref:Ribulose-phosphate 3-epimerase n=1 Tax=Tectimicrobiota bacterium TaxID=2528274 RepID=A0A938B4Y8_UNCTE|nr:ribulose-phosphate 3-epimerase [Candidatus Tectomicrobia bacterium]
MTQIAPSILAADFARLGDEIARVEAAGADLLHVDVMDGHFVPNLTIGPPVVKALKAVTDLPLDVHLMVQEPDALLPAFIDAGSANLTVHVEACRHLHRTIQIIKDAGVHASVVLNPATPLHMLEEILPELHMVLLMSVNPGFGGQRFIPGTLEKIRTLKHQITERNLQVAIEVDGGVNASNARAICDAGADVLVAGTAIFGQPDYAEAIRALRA